MKCLIIASGHCGSTLKVANIIANEIGGDVFDTSLKPTVDFKNYDAFIFGANVRMFSINGRCKKWAKKLSKIINEKPVFAYIVGSDFDNKDKYISKMKKIIPNAIDVIHAGGELIPENATGFAKMVVESVIADHVNKAKELPSINIYLVTEFAKKILLQTKNL